MPFLRVPVKFKDGRYWARTGCPRRIDRIVNGRQVMDDSMNNSRQRKNLSLRCARRAVNASLYVLFCLLNGCAAFHPIPGIPASHVPPEFLGPSRDGLRPLNPMLLTRSRPPEHLVDAGDVLSIYIPGILGTVSPDFTQIGEQPPINIPIDPEMPPTIGFPIQVRGNGTIALPQIAPIPVRGMTLAQVQEAIRKAYTEPERKLTKGEERILVSLQRPREYRVLVVRQELATTPIDSVNIGNINIGSTQRGTARIVRLKAYENDVLHALAREQGVDGLPGLDAENAIYVIRRRGSGGCGISPQRAPLMTPDMPHGPVIRFQSSTAPVRGGHAALVSPMAMPRPRVTTRSNKPGDSYFSRYSTASPASARFSHSTSMVPRQTTYQPSMVQGAASFVPYGRPLPRASRSNMVQPSGRQPAVYQASHVSQPLPSMGVQGVPYAEVFPGTPEQPVYGQNGMGDIDTYFDSMLVGGMASTIDGPGVIKIPIRISSCDVPHIREEDITLYDGDIVFVESRGSEVFYTGGLLGGGQYLLPRDYDLRVLEALSIAQSVGQGGNSPRGVGGISSLNQDVTVSASKVIVRRRLADGTTIPIEVDINRAKRDMTGRENIIVQPGDYLILQYSRLEAVAAFFERHLLEGALFGLAASNLQNNGN